MTQQIAPAISTVNYHVWKPCNMKCQFCFATFVDISEEVLPVAGQNDLTVDRHLVSNQEFETYIQSASMVKLHSIKLTAESNNLTTGSYVMVDPAGRFLDNTAGRHTYSQPILEVGAEIALQEPSVDHQKFVARDGLYNWTNAGNGDRT